MANVDKAFGLRPYKGLNVGSAVQEVNKYNIAPAGYNTNIFQGDLVIFAGGYINRSAAGSANIVGVFRIATMLQLTAPRPLRIITQRIRLHSEVAP